MRVLSQKGGSIGATRVMQALKWRDIELDGRCKIEGDLVFSADINFKITIVNCIFTGDVNFNSSRFNKDIDFSGSHFNEIVYFSGSRFKECVKFVGADFKKSAHFDCTIFYKNADFDSAHSIMMSHLMMQDFRHLEIIKLLNLIMRSFKVKRNSQTWFLKAIIN